MMYNGRALMRQSRAYQNNQRTASLLLFDMARACENSCASHSMHMIEWEAMHLFGSDV